MTILLEPVGIGEMGVVHAELARLGVHEHNELIHGTRDVLGNVARGIVARVDEHDAQKIAERRSVIRGESRRLRVGPEIDVVDRADGVEIHPAVESDDRRHDLGDRCHAHLTLYVLAPQDASRGVDDDGRLRLLDLGSRLERVRGRADERNARKQG